MLALTPDPSPVSFTRAMGKRALPSPLDGRRAGDEGNLREKGWKAVQTPRKGGPKHRLHFF